MAALLVLLGCFVGAEAAYEVPAINLKEVVVKVTGPGPCENLTAYADPEPGSDPLTGQNSSFGYASPALRDAPTFSNGNKTVTAWGMGWFSDNDQYAQLNPNNSVTLTDGAGNRGTFFRIHVSSSGLPVYGSVINSYVSLTVASMANGAPSSLVMREPGGTSRVFEVYESSSVLRLAELADRYGNTVEYARDSQGRLTRVTDVHGRWFAMTYNDAGFVATLSDSGGRTRTYAYDGQGHRTGESGPLGSTSYTYDSENRITRITYPNGGVKNYTYDSQNRVLTKDDGDGANLKAYVYGSSRTTITDALGRPTVYEYIQKNGLKRANKMTDPSGGVTKYGYDSNMNLVSQTDPLGRITRYTYDDKGNVTETQDSAGGRTLTSYDEVYSQPLSILDPLSHRTEFNYNSQGNEIQLIDALLGVTNKAYDSYGHMTRYQDPLSNETAYTYKPSNGAMSSITDPLKRVTSMETDELSRVVRNTDPAGRSMLYSYDDAGSLLQTADALGNVTRYTYNPGRTSMLMASVTDAKNHTTSFGYDDLGRRTFVTNALGQNKTSAYDTKGNLVQSKNARNQTIAYAYDNMDRLSTKTLPEGEVSYTYDAVGNLTRVEHPNGSVVANVYDAMNRVTQTQQTLPGGFSATIGYAYDAAGNRAQMTTPWGNFSYQYDSLNHLTKISNPQNEAFTLAYDAAGRRTSLSYPNGIVASYGYDAAGQLLSLTHIRIADNVVIASAAYVYDKAGNRTSMADDSGLHSYGYDGLYRLASANHPLASRLPILNEVFGYDAVGNRLADAAINGYQYDAANRLLENSIYTYTYDADGNQTGKTDKATSAATSYSYDSENRLTQVTLADGKVWMYKYDAQGRRIQKSSGTAANQITKYVYDKDNIVAMIDGNNSLITLYTNGLGIDEPLMMRRADGNEYGIHGDPLNSVIAHSDLSGTLVEQVRYGAYGKPTFVDLRIGPVIANESFTGDPLAFTARLWDGSTRLYDYRNRQTYDPETGRWGQSDPIGLTGRNVDLYAYVNNSPTKFRDPKGTQQYNPNDKIDAAVKLNDIVQRLMAKGYSAQQIFAMVNGGQTLGLVCLPAGATFMAAAIAAAVAALGAYSVLRLLESILSKEARIACPIPELCPESAFDPNTVVLDPPRM